MEKRIATFTIFTFLLFAISTAQLALDQIDLPGSNTVLPAHKPEPEVTDKTAANDKTTQTFEVRSIDPAKRLIFSRSLGFIRRHPCRKFKKSFMIPMKRSYGNDMISSDKTITFDLGTIGDPIPIKQLEFKHEYGHHHHHYHHDKDEKDEKFEIKYESDWDKLSNHHKKEKKREHKGGFMRRVRKFLKHTFD